MESERVALRMRDATHQSVVHGWGDHQLTSCIG